MARGASPDARTFVKTSHQITLFCQVANVQSANRRWVPSVRQHNLVVSPRILLFIGMLDDKLAKVLQCFKPRRVGFRLQAARPRPTTETPDDTAPSTVETYCLPRATGAPQTTDGLQPGPWHK